MRERDEGDSVTCVVESTRDRSGGEDMMDGDTES